MSILDRAKEVTGWAAVLGRVAVKSEMLGRPKPEGLAATARVLASGKAGVSAILRIRAANEGDQTAFVFEGQRRTFRDVDRRVDLLATGLRRRGVRQRDAVALVLHNRPEFFELEGAMARLGASAVSVSWRSTPAELAYLFRHSGARAVFFEHELAPHVEAALAECPALTRERLFPVGGFVPGLAEYESVLALRPDRDLDSNEGAVVIYTSGTTGKPKGAVRDFGIGQALGFVAFMERVPMKRGDVHLCVCPLYHSTGLGFAGMALMVGGTVVIERDFNPERFLKLIEREQVTTTALVPTMLHRLMALDPATLAAARTDTLRTIYCGGAQLPGPLAERALDQFGPVLYNFYGATETGLVTVATPDDLRALPGTIGKALHGVSIRLLDEQGAEVAPGEPGELYAKNNMLVTGYHADETATRSSMRDGYFSVGDLATVDRDGRYMIVGRRRDMVISGGVNIYPAEVEEVIARHPDVSQAAVVGVPDDEWGERLRAFVVLRPSATGHAPTDAASLRAWCRERLSGPKVPREWAFLDALPSNPTGKILKRELRLYDGEITRA